MLSDSMAPVRNAANDLLVLSYIKFGDRIKTDLLKSQIPDDKIKRLLKVRFKPNNQSNIWNVKSD